MQSDSETDLTSRIYKNLEKVVDPEIGINIVDLGLIYDLNVDNDNNVTILMTLTAPNCPFGEEILEGVEYAGTRIEEVNEVKINLTFKPPWNPEKISDAAKYYMGIM
jgi:metal-sulfur cluster biosynthetic enzyme|tara:strand:- start:2670 stop:2990 length:321 start_codon:yes stop_codon:yes gene_type:complete